MKEVFIAVLAAFLAIMAMPAEAHNNAKWHDNTNHRHICMWGILKDSWRLETVTSYTGVYSRARSGNDLSCKPTRPLSCPQKYTDGRLCSPSDDWYKSPIGSGSSVSNRYPANGCSGINVNFRSKESPICMSSEPSDSYITQTGFVFCDNGYHKEGRQCVADPVGNSCDGSNINYRNECILPQTCTAKTAKVFGSNRQFTGATVNLAIGRQLDRPSPSPEGYCNCPGNYSSYKKGNNDLCGPAQCDRIHDVGWHTSCSGHSGELLPHNNLQQQVSDESENESWLHHMLSSGESPVGEGFYGFNTGSDDRAVDYETIRTMTKSIIVSLTYSDGTLLSCSFAEGSTVVFSWESGHVLTFVLRKDAKVKNGDRCRMKVHTDRINGVEPVGQNIWGNATF